MSTTSLGRRIALAIALAGAALGLAVAGCGGDDDDSDSTAAGGTDLSAVKTYLTDHTARLRENVGLMNTQAQRYYELAKSESFDYGRLLAEHRAEVQEILESSKKAYVAANPSYEEMEGIVGGVPSLSHYDVDIDAGSDASDPENAVSFDLKQPDGEVRKQPGNLFFLTETALYGTNPDFLAKGVSQDVDGDGRVEFGEGVPDANFYVAATKEFSDQASSLDEDAQGFEPTSSDAFTALTVMTPTMSELFDAWRTSRFVAGDAAKEQTFVAASRLGDITGIVGGLVLTYDQLTPLVSGEDPQQAKQTQSAYDDLFSFAKDLRDQESSGRHFSPEEADTLGAEAQRRAEAITGQVTQAAQRLGVEIQE